MNYFKSQNKTNKNGNLIEEKFDETFVHKNLLDIIFSCCPKENSKVRPYFINFVAKIVTLGKFKMEFELCLDSALFLLENPAGLNTIEKKQNVDVLNEEYNEEKSRLILNLLKIWESELLTKNLNKLIESAELSPL